jgi:hypothetical protein
MTNVITGSASAYANIIYIGDGFGAVQADGSGNYTVTVNNGTYVLSAYAVGISFSPNALAVVVAGSDVPSQNFTPTTLTVSSPLDSRVVPNLDRVIQAAQIFDVDRQLSASPPLDCRKAGAPVDCRVSPPLTSRK